MDALFLLQLRYSHRTYERADIYGLRRIAQIMVDAAVTSAASARIAEGSRMSKAGLLSPETPYVPYLFEVGQQFLRQPWFTASYLLAIARHSAAPASSPRSSKCFWRRAM